MGPVNAAAPQPTPSAESAGTLRVALAQITPAEDPPTAIDQALAAVTEAAQQGARLVVLPEATLAPFGTDLAAAAREHADRFDVELTALARELGVVIIAGSVTTAPDGRVHNTLLVRGPRLAADYRKLHLYDAFGTVESETVAPGEHLVTVEVDGITVGCATCYDVRFPEQFRALARAGAEVIALPAAWGDGDGKLEQWRLLIRARALDSTAIVLACDQAAPIPAVDAPRGVGHSAVISPMGVCEHELGPGSGILLADLDVSDVHRARRLVPVLEHEVALPPVQRAAPSA